MKMDESPQEWARRLVCEYDTGEDDADEPFDMDDDRDCYWCCGGGWTECSDPIQCTHEHNQFGECRCSSCGGSGLAKDMTIW